MQAFPQQKYQQMIATAAKYVSIAVEKYLLPSVQKQFMLWMLAEGSLYQEDYLRMMGVAGSIELELVLLSEVVGHNVFEKMQHDIGILNAYFAFETLSDNIGIGLGAAQKNNNPTYAEQRELLLAFNHAMIAKLNGDQRSAVELLTPYIALTKKISAYERCLLPSQMYQFAQKFQEHHPSVSLTELEHSFFAILVLNIETCIDLLNAMQGHAIYDFLKTSLIDRYVAVNATLNVNATFSMEEIADIGAKSMLVMPSLAFCVGAMDKASPNNKLILSLQNNLLIKTFYTASLLVRLLNDLGTQMLELSPLDSEQLLIQLNFNLTENKNASFFEFLQTVAESEKFFQLMPRIRKDIKHGEYNISLDNLKDLANLTAALNEFMSRVSFFAALYKQQCADLIQQGAALAALLADPKPGKIAINFVNFHQIMYSKEFETKYGDYAITNTSLDQSKLAR